MSDFKYITDTTNIITDFDKIFAEQAHQLKRIADALEHKESAKAPDAFFWNFHIWTRAYIVEVSPVERHGLSTKMFRFYIESKIGDLNLCNPYEYSLEIEAEAARAEFIRLWEGE